MTQLLSYFLLVSFCFPLALNQSFVKLSKESPCLPTSSLGIMAFIRDPAKWSRGSGGYFSRITLKLNLYRAHPFSQQIPLYAVLLLILDEHNLSEIMAEGDRPCFYSIKKLIRDLVVQDLLSFKKKSLNTDNSPKLSNSIIIQMPKLTVPNHSHLRIFEF